MSRRNLLITLGIILIITPLLGVPGIWKSTLSILIGVGVVYLSFGAGKIKRQPSKNIKRKKETLAYAHIDGGPINSKQAREIISPITTSPNLEKTESINTETL